MRTVCQANSNKLSLALFLSSSFFWQRRSNNKCFGNISAKKRFTHLSISAQSAASIRLMEVQHVQVVMDCIKELAGGIASPASEPWTEEV